MPISDLKSSSNNTFHMAFRRNYRWILLCFFIVIVIYLHGGINSDPAPRLEITHSTYDWSKWKPHHPITSIQPLPTAPPRKLPRIQHKPTKPSKFDVAVQEKRREFVKSTLAKSWKGYKKFAWMRDELTPVSGGFRDTFGGWAASAVDALDTLWIMGMKQEFHEAVRAVVTIDWSKTEGTSCNMFETTIRHLGGLISAYDLSKEPALLDKAIELGDMLYAAFDTPNHMPPFWLDYEKAKKGLLIADDHQPAASATSLSLEFTRLAQLTGNHKYYDAVARVTDRLFESQNHTKIPGMWPTFFNLRHEDGIFIGDNSFTLGALSDSMYEYVLKMQLLLGGTEPKYEQMYRTATKAIIENILFRPMTPDNQDILFSGSASRYQQTELNSETEHLACFAGGMFAMGGKLYNIPEHVRIGARLTKGCIWAYDSFPHGIAPEIFKVVPCDSMDDCPWDEEKWKESAIKDGYGYPPKGIESARDPKYILRPEALESVFILYRITGDEEYRDASWRMFQNIVKATDTEYGNSAIDNVKADIPIQVDEQESFWFAETLKYAYLTFSPPDYMSLDDFVLNTEAHPLRVPKS